MTKNNKKSELFLRKINEMKDISGFLNIHKYKSDNVKGFKWVYTYKKDGKSYNIVNTHLFVLKNIVTSKNLPWEIIDESQAKKSVDLEKSKYFLFDKGLGILFLDIINELYNPFNGFWHYKFGGNEFYDICLEKLKRKVLTNNLPWIILSKTHASDSFKRDLTNDFESGVYMVNKLRHDQYNNLIQWVYIYEKDGEFNFIIDDDLTKLKDIVNKNGFKWKIINDSMFKRSLKENKENLNQISDKKWAFTGISRVRKIRDDEILQGFLWVYRDRRGGTTVNLSSTDLNELKEKVIKNNLEWLILDKNAANDSIMKNQENQEKYGFRTNKNKTGIYRVYKSKDDSKQGFHWTYRITINKETFTFTSVNLLKLKQTVLNEGFEWIVIDNELAKKSFKKNEDNLKRYHIK